MKKTTKVINCPALLIIKPKKLPKLLLCSNLWENFPSFYILDSRVGSESTYIYRKSLGFLPKNLFLSENWRNWRLSSHGLYENVPTSLCLLSPDSGCHHQSLCSRLQPLPTVASGGASAQLHLISASYYFKNLLIYNIRPGITIS